MDGGSIPPISTNGRHHRQKGRPAMGRPFCVSPTSLGPSPLTVCREQGDGRRPDERTLMSTIPLQQPPPQHRTSAGSVVMVILGSLLTLLGLPVLTGGVVASGAAAVQGSDGFFTTPTSLFTTNTFALTTPQSDEFTGASTAPRLPFDIGELLVR